MAEYVGHINYHLSISINNWHESPEQRALAWEPGSIACTHILGQSKSTKSTTLPSLISRSGLYSDREQVRPVHY